MDEGEDTGEGGGGGLDPELIKSYLNFLRRAVRGHRLMMSLVFMAGLILTVGAYRYLPRSYTCQTVLMVDSNKVLEGDYGPNGLAAAESLIMRHENLEAIVRETGQIKKFKERRARLLALKDRVIAALFGEPSEETMMAVLVGTIESKLDIRVNSGTLTLTIEWTDGDTAAEIVQAARENFVKARHQAEMSAFEEKLTILDAHASSLRDEIEDLAKQARALIDNHATERAAARAAVAPTTSDAAAPAAPRPRPRVEATEDVQGPELKAQLDSKRKKLADFDRDQQQRVADERRKLEDLKLRLTPNHPDVAREQQRLAALQQEPSDIALLRSEVQTLDGELKQHDLLTRHGGAPGGSRSVLAGGPGALLDPLPRDIGQLMDAQNIDPALAAQLTGAVSRYGSLRDDIRSGRIQFDTAQAAFNFRYKVVVPAEAPHTPTKPKPATIFAAGLLLSLLLAIVLPIIAELRTGLVVERWQVAVVQIPVLADLRLPPASGGPQSSGPLSKRD
jgi:uncharacterized protein involved in exopolysaccharide biosynthesis